MKNFDEAVLAIEQQNQLKRVRLKLDPKIREAQDYSEYDGYEGYVLSETDTHVQLQVFNKGKVTIPKVVLEGKGIGMAAAGASKALNPMTYLKGAERVLSAPVRALDKLVGGSEKQEKIQPQIDTINVGIYNSTTLQLGREFADAITSQTGTQIQSSVAADVAIRYFSMGSELQQNPSKNKDYVIIAGSSHLDMPGRGRYSYSKTNVPFGPHGTKLLNVFKNKNVVVDDNLMQLISAATSEIQLHVNKLATTGNHKIVFDVLHVPSFQLFEMGGYLTRKSGDNFVLSNKEQKASY